MSALSGSRTDQQDVVQVLQDPTPSYKGRLIPIKAPTYPRRELHTLSSKNPLFLPKCCVCGLPFSNTHEFYSYAQLLQ